MNTKPTDTKAPKELEGVTVLKQSTVPTYGSAKTTEFCTVCAMPSARTDRNGIGRCCA